MLARCTIHIRKSVQRALTDTLAYVSRVFFSQTISALTKKKQIHLHSCCTRHLLACQDLLYFSTPQASVTASRVRHSASSSSNNTSFILSQCHAFYLLAVFTTAAVFPFVPRLCKLSCGRRCAEGHIDTHKTYLVHKRACAYIYPNVIQVNRQRVDSWTTYLQNESAGGRYHAPVSRRKKSDT